MRRHPYLIEVRGGRGDCPAFDGWHVRCDGDVITISGDMDSAALHGVLRRIRERRLDLLGVSRIPPGDAVTGAVAVG